MRLLLRVSRAGIPATGGPMARSISTVARSTQVAAPPHRRSPSHAEAFSARLQPRPLRPHSSRYRLYSTAPTKATEIAFKGATVPDRGVVEMKGKDTVKLLQGLVSNDVRKLEKEEVDCVFACFGNPQGRMLADAFIHRLPPSSEDGSQRWLLDVDSRTMSSLLSFIKRFKLRSKVTIKDVSNEWNVVQIWGGSDGGSLSTDVLGSTDDSVVSRDARAPGMGVRAVVRGRQGLEALASSTGATEVDGTEYTVQRILHGVAEGAVDFPEGSSMPLENNMDYMNGVDFRKGCYVGQELTARTHHTGVVRKRLMPLSFYLPGTPAPSTLCVDTSFTTILPSPLTEVRSKPIVATSQDGDGAAAVKKPARGRSAGKFTTGVYNVGLGCLRLEQVKRWQDPTSVAAQQGGGGEDGLQFSFENAEGQTILVKPWIPNWWPEVPAARSEEEGVEL